MSDNPENLARLARIGQVVGAEHRPEGTPHFDMEKVWGLFTTREAKMCKKALARRDQEAVLTYIITALTRSGRPLAEFMSRKRERIVV